MGNSGKNIALHTLWQDYLQGTLVNTINEIAGAVVDFSALVFGILKWLNPNWHDAGYFYPPCNFGIGFCQLNLYQKFPNFFGGEN